MRYKVRVPDVEYFRELFNCYYACPVNTRAGQYVSQVAEGKYEEAYLTARDPNPLVYICGKVCAHPCETACRRGIIDAPVSIRALKRKATERHNIDLGHTAKILDEKERPIDNKKVAVIGGGPAGITAAHELAVRGYKVTIFESASVLGGMLKLGLPRYRLSSELVDFELDSLLKPYDIEIVLNKRLDSNFDLNSLKELGFHAVFISIGAHMARMPRIEGVDYDGVLNGVDFLLNANLGYKVDLGERVIVVGGGNVAMDVARTAIRHAEDIDSLNSSDLKEMLKEARSVITKMDEVGAVEGEEIRVALDTARSALRLGVKDITIVCMESREEMPAHEEEINDAVTEGINLVTSVGPRRIVGDKSMAKGLELIKVKSVFDNEGRFNPSFEDGTEYVLEADTIILAIGQTSDLGFIKERDGLEITPRNTIKVDSDTLETSVPYIFAGGDVAFGPRLIIDAVADGKKAAASIDRYLNQKASITVRKTSIKKLDNVQLSPGYDMIERQKIPALPIERRVGIAEIELGYSDKDADTEGKRCLKCYINTIFDQEKCILCGGCIDICPMYCYKLVKYDDVFGDEILKGVIQRRYQGAGKGGQGVVIIKDEERCIRCALCAKRCPTGTITMEHFEFSEEIYERE